MICINPCIVRLNNMFLANMFNRQADTTLRRLMNLKNVITTEPLSLARVKK